MFEPHGPTLRELIRQALSSTKDGYDQLAPKFDRTPFLTPKKIIDAVGEQLKKEGEFNTAIDLCTGTGAGIEGLLPIVHKEIVGVDWSQPMLLKAKMKFPHHYYHQFAEPKVEFVCDDVFNMTDYPSKFDLATCFGALGHIEKSRQKEFVDKVCAVLKPEGIFAFRTYEYLKWYHPSAWPYFVFDAVMRIRNHFIKPEFVMYYLNFLLPEILELFDKERWSSVRAVPLEIPGKKTTIQLVLAKKK